MDEVPSVFWMIIVTGLSAMLGLVLYYLAMLFRESTSTVKEFRYLVVELHDITDSAKAFLERINRTSEMISNTVETVSSTILQPVATISMWVTAAKSMVSKFMGDEPDVEEELVEE